MLRYSPTCPYPHTSSTTQSHAIPCNISFNNSSINLFYYTEIYLNPGGLKFGIVILLTRTDYTESDPQESGVYEILTNRSFCVVIVYNP